MSEVIWGVDLGGTKIEGVVLEIEAGTIKEELARIRVPTEQEHGYSHILEQILLLRDRLSANTLITPSAIGFGTPGVLDPVSGLLKNSNTACLRGKPLQADLEKVLGCHVTIANDANCFALAEARFGAAQGKSMVFGVIMGTGVGGGLILNECARYGLQGIAGEFGHTVIDPAGDPCYCGKQGCVERFMSGSALEAYYKNISGMQKSLSDILSIIETDQWAAKTRDRLLWSFGLSISTLINILDPDIIVLGGGLSNIPFLYTEGVQAITKNVFNDYCLTPIVQNILGDSAGVYGAACLVSTNFQ